jgi:hypothetical protein
MARFLFALGRAADAPAALKCASEKLGKRRG